MNTYETYVSLEVAKLLKQAGFDWPVMHFYDEFEDGKIPFYSRGAEELQQNMNAFGYYSAPTLSVAQKWLREVKGIDIMVRIDYHYGEDYSKAYCGTFDIGDKLYTTEHFNTYEEAQEAGIKKCLELILKEE